MSLDQGNRCEETGMDIRHKGHLTQHGEVVTQSAGTAADPLISQLGSLLVVAHGTAVESLSSNTWTSRHTLNATPTDVRNGSLGGTEFLVFCYTSGYAFSSSVATWNVNNSQNTLNIEFHNERFWGIDATGQLWYTFTMGSAEVNDAKLPLSHGEVVTGLIEARAHGEGFILYAVTSKGLWAHDIGNRKFVRMTGINLPNNTVLGHERPAVVWQERIYLAAGRGIIEYDPVAATVRRMGFDLDDGLPAGQDGRISCLAASVNELLAGTAQASSNDDPVIMAWDGRGWGKRRQESGGDIESMHIGDNLSSHGDDSHLYWGSANRVKRILLNVSGTRTGNIDGWLTNVATANTNHVYPVFDAGQEDVTKVLLKLKVEVADTASTRTVQVFFSINGGTVTQLDQTYTNDSTFDAGDDDIDGDGITTFSFPSVATPSGTEFRTLQISFRTLQTSVSSTAAVDILSVTIEYLKVLDQKLGFDFELDFTKPLGGRTPKQLRAAYATAQALKTLPELTYRDDDGGTRNYYVKVLGGQGDELTGHEERGSQLVRCEQP